MPPHINPKAKLAQQTARIKIDAGLKKRTARAATATNASNALLPRNRLHAAPVFPQ